MRLCALAVVLAVSLVLAPLVAEAQQTGKIARIGFLVVSMSPVSSPSGKRLELLKQIVPRLTRVAFLINPSSPTSPHHVREAQKAATALGIRLQIVEVRDPDGFERALVVIAKDRPDALYVVGNPNLFSQRPRVLGLVERTRLPAIWSESTWVTEGGLIGYAPNQPAMFRRGAWYVDRILRGAKPADLPVEQPTKFELRINLKAAKALGLTIPQTLLLQADQVIE